MSIALDTAVVLVILITAFIGYKRGFVRSLLRMVGTVACVVIALIVSDMLSAPVYNKIVAPRIEKKVLGKLENFDIAKEVGSALRNLGVDIGLDNKQIRKALSDPGSIASAFERAVISSGGSEKEAALLKETAEGFFTDGFDTVLAQKLGVKDYEAMGERVDFSLGTVYDLVRNFATGDDNSAGVHYLVSNVINGVATKIIRYILFTVLLIILEIILSVVFRLAGVLDHLPVVKSANNTLGLILGIAKGVLYVGLIAAICSAIAKTDQIIDPAAFSDTFLFKLFFNFFYK